MFKLLVTLATFLAVALTVFSLRQERLEISAQSARTYRDIENRTDTLRSQRVEITRETSPMALAAGLKSAGMDVGDALILRDGRAGRGKPAPRATPSIETDLLAPLQENVGGGHGNANRPRG